MPKAGPKSRKSFRYEIERINSLVPRDTHRFLEPFQSRRAGKIISAAKPVASFSPFFIVPRNVDLDGRITRILRDLEALETSLFLVELSEQLRLSFLQIPEQYFIRRSSGHECVAGVGCV